VLDCLGFSDVAKMRNTHSTRASPAGFKPQRGWKIVSLGAIVPCSTSVRYVETAVPSFILARRKRTDSRLMNQRGIFFAYILFTTHPHILPSYGIKYWYWKLYASEVIDDNTVIDLSWLEYVKSIPLTSEFDSMKSSIQSTITQCSYAQQKKENRGQGIDKGIKIFCQWGSSIIRSSRRSLSP
jgi:hypothetical protein